MLDKGTVIRIYNVEGISNEILLHYAQPACLQTFSLVRGGLKPPKGVAYGTDLHTRRGLFSPRPNPPRPA